MSDTFDSRLGEQLYRLLPEVYRTRDRRKGRSGEGSGMGDLGKYLDAHGHLLDLIHATLEQLARDALPDSSQDWLLPYFGRLLAVEMVSPESGGRHAEIAHAVSWRQRKGTLQCAEEIAEAVGRMEVEIQEGWKRLAMTPRMGMPLMPVYAWDDTLHIDMKVPSQAIRHPELPAAMVDFRRSSRAVPSDPAHPAARRSDLGGIEQTWRMADIHGVPCFPGSFADHSRRTVDMRTPRAADGRYHHKRLLAFTPPPMGFYTFDAVILTWDGRPETLPEHLMEVQTVGGVISIRNRTKLEIAISNHVTLETDIGDPVPTGYRIEGLHFQGGLSLPEGVALEMVGVEAALVDVDATARNTFVLTARDCLFGVLDAAGPVKLDSCTVLDTALFTAVEAIDCIFMDFPNTGVTGSVRYSRIPDHAQLNVDTDMPAVAHRHPESHTRNVGADPRFISGQKSLAARALLSPHAPAAVYAGAIDRGEMGYYHHGRRHRPVHIQGDISDGTISMAPPADGGYPLKDVIFDAPVVVTAGRLELVRCAAPQLTVDPPANAGGGDLAGLRATDSLFTAIDAAQAHVRLAYCTVMTHIHCKQLQASDSIFVGDIQGVEITASDASPAAVPNCLRHSSIPSALVTGVEERTDIDSLKKMLRALGLVDKEGRLTLGTNTSEGPLFDATHHCADGNGLSGAEQRQPHYGEWGYGVLGLMTPPAVRFGAEDGGEMGAYHHKHYSLKAAAMLEKLRAFLPVGIDPVLIQDSRLLQFLTDNSKP